MSEDNPWSPEWANAVFPLEERELRWKKVRGLMARDGIDLIICLPNTHNYDRAQADSRYLTQLGENGDETTVAFPVEGKVTAWLSRGGAWPGSNWVGDIRPQVRGGGGTTITSWLNENPPYQKATIAIAGLTASPLSHMRSAEGEVMWGSVELLKKNFPAARFVSATPILGEARYRKSAAEIDYIRRGTRIAEIELEALRRHAREGASERQLFAEMIYANASAGGSFPPQIGWCSGPQGRVYHRIAQPSFRKLARGDAMLLEIEGRWGGYIAQIDQTLVIAEPTPEMIEGMKLTIEAFERVRAKMAPGARIADLIAAASLKSRDGRIETGLGFHGRGTGNDGPLLVAFRPEPQQVLDIVIEEDCAFIIKPSARVDGVEDYSRWGDSVVVTARGAERLGTRKPALIVQN
ncbi:MAG TPA: M24 family metallopeptidase [Stellaceae bacterium]|nr:M24 family metallopeptidase [Stellaceae bacterium]